MCCDRGKRTGRDDKIIEYDENIPIVFLRDEGVFGEALHLGAHMSLIKYYYGGIEYIEWMPAEDYVLWDNLILKHEEYDEEE